MSDEILQFCERLEARIEELERLAKTELLLSDELKRSISVDIVRHILHELEYGRGVKEGKDETSKLLKVMWAIWNQIPEEEQDLIIQEWIDWGIGAISSRGL
jgi:hypothetical protein